MNDGAGPFASAILFCVLVSVLVAGGAFGSGFLIGLARVCYRAGSAVFG